MKSYANVKGHPIHPALIPFPIAFLLGALLFDAGAWWTGRPEWGFTAFHLLQVGILAGVVAAIPGILDFWKRVPPASSGSARALRHGAANATALVLFTVAWLLRRHGDITSGTLALEIAGALALGYGGWLGGVLVSRNLISVDHRHANAGKWSEARFSTSNRAPIVVAEADELGEGQMKLLIVGGTRIVLARTAGGFTAFGDGCTHRGASLADGVCAGGIVQCLWHGSQFDAHTGEVRCGPAKKKLAVYAVSERDGRVMLESPA
jgi:nitrite reductase/ring-hydroxylating ferredoxin subunit/uncharacterized membrane protein